MTTTRAASGAPLLSYDDIFGDRSGSPTPERLRFTDDGQTLSYLLRSDDDKDLWGLTIGSQQPVILLGGKDLESGGNELSLDSYQWSPDGDSLLLPSKGDLYLYSLARGTARRLTESDEEAEGAKFSPDGGAVSFVRSANLWLVDLETGIEKQLTEDGRPGELLLGKTDWVYWEEIWGRSSTGHWWSPDSRRIALYRFDESGVGHFPILNSVELDPKVEKQRYPRAGEANPIVSVGVLELDSNALRWLDTGSETDQYLARVEWSRDGKRILIHRLNRAQNHLELLTCEAGGTRCEVLLEERSDSWIDLGNDYSFLADGRIVWSSDRDGWRRLYLYSAKGELERPLSPRGVAVTSIHPARDSEDWLLYSAHSTGSLGAKDRTLYRVNLSSGESEILSPIDGWHAAQVSRDGLSWVHTRSTANEAPRVHVHRRKEEGTAPGDWPTVDLVVGTEAGIDRSELPQWEFLEIDGPNGAKLPARMLRPSGEDGQRHPTLMYHYGGPASQVVMDSSSRKPTRDLWHLRMAQRGYVVLQVDNEASRFFGKRGAERLHGQFGELELRAQLAAVDYLRSLPFVDSERIGLWGWSGGGANTLYSILKSPGTWRAAVAGAPVTDWRLYDTIWTERYLGLPADNPDGYRDSSAITWATNPADPLLLVHGTADDNVHPNNTLVLSQKLIEAGIPFEQALYPRQKHGFSSKHSRHFYERMEEFFDRHLRR